MEAYLQLKWQHFGHLVAPWSTKGDLTKNFAFTVENLDFCRSRGLWRSLGKRLESSSNAFGLHSESKLALKSIWTAPKGVQRAQRTSRKPGRAVQNADEAEELHPVLEDPKPLARTFV